MTHHTPSAPAPAIFTFDGLRAVRVIDIDGSPWFVAADVCAALELSNSRMSLQALDPEERGVSSTYTTEGVRKVGVINESGLYTLILRCRDATTAGTLPHRFRKWVTAEVIPEIRKTGRYGQPDEMEVSLFRGQGAHRTCDRYMIRDSRLTRSDANPVSDLIETSTKLLSIARNLMHGSGATAGPAQTRLAELPQSSAEQEYQDTLARVIAILRHDPAPSGTGWTAGALERTHGGTHGRLKIAEKALRRFIADALRRGDLTHRPGPARGHGYLQVPSAS